MSGVITAVAVTGAYTANEGRKTADASRREGRRATNAQLSAEERMFDISRADQAPFMGAGVAANNQQRMLLGLGASDNDAGLREEIQGEIAGLQEVWDPNGEKTAEIQLWKERGGSKGRKKARRLEGDRNLFNADFATLQRKNQIQALEKELSGLSPIDSRTPQEQQREAFQNFVESPGQKFMRDRAQKNLKRNSAAIGGLGGGNVRSDLVQQGVGFAQQDFQNQFARLGQLAGQGQASAQNVAGLGNASIGRQGQLVSNQVERSTGLRREATDARNEGIGELVQLGGRVSAANPSSVGRVDWASGVQGPQPN